MKKNPIMQPFIILNITNSNECFVVKFPTIESIKAEINAAPNT